MNHIDDRRSIETVFDCFVENFLKIALEENLDVTNGVPITPSSIRHFLLGLNSTHVDIQKFSQTIDIEKVFSFIVESFPNKPIENIHVAVAPCSVLIDDLTRKLIQIFPNISLIDKSRIGQPFANHLIVSPDDIDPVEYDVCLVLTRNQDAIEFYDKLFSSQILVNLNDEKFCMTLEDSTYGSTSPKNQKCNNFLSRVNESEFPILISTAQPRATIQTTATQLTKDGIDVYWALSQDVDANQPTSYGTPRSSDLDIKEFTVTDWKGLMFLFCNQEQGAVVYHYEEAYAPAWDFRRISISYAMGLATCRTVKQMRSEHSTAKLIFLMYDAIKPGIKNFEWGKAASSIYKQLMVEAEGILFSSYTKGFGDFVEQSVGKKIARAHFHRYQVNATNKRARRTDGYHVAIISVALEEFFEPSRTGLKPYIRDAIESGIHIHYYAGITHHAYIETFRDTLSPSARKRFHIHNPIHDLALLSEELSEYHAGWCLLNMQVFNMMVTELEDQFMRDAMDMFTPTTLPSVMWTCAAAGLPVICNRSMFGVMEVLPKELAIPMQLSEAHSLYRILDNMDWASVDKVSRDHLDMENRIHEFYDFIKEISDVDVGSRKT